jgi:Pyridoxal-dependent decarboxylase conserved domain
LKFWILLKSVRLNRKKVCSLPRKEGQEFYQQKRKRSRTKKFNYNDFLLSLIPSSIFLIFFLQNRCVNIIARLFNAPLSDKQAAVGVGTVGSSEAIMLAGLAFKRKWQNKRKVQGKPFDKPNIVTGANVQVL